MSRPAVVELEAALAIMRLGSFRAAAPRAWHVDDRTQQRDRQARAPARRSPLQQDHRSVSPTDAGRSFAEQVGPALASIHAAMNNARSHQQTPSGTLRINAFATAAREILAPLVLECLTRYPQIHIDLVTEGRLADVVAAGFDFGVRSADPVPSDTIAISWGERAASARWRRRHISKSTTSPASRRTFWHIHASGCACPMVLCTAGLSKSDGEAIQIDAKGPITLDEASLSRIAVLKDVGTGYFMEADVRDDVAAGRLVSVLEDWAPTLAPLCLYVPQPTPFIRSVPGVRCLGTGVCGR